MYFQGIVTSPPHNPTLHNHQALSKHNNTDLQQQPPPPPPARRKSKTLETGPPRKPLLESGPPPLLMMAPGQAGAGAATMNPQQMQQILQQQLMANPQQLQQLLQQQQNIVLQHQVSFLINYWVQSQSATVIFSCILSLQQPSKFCLCCNYFKYCCNHFGLVSVISISHPGNKLKKLWQPIPNLLN